MIWRLSAICPERFPDPAFAEPSGLLAVGGDLSPRRLLAAYTQGIFPWYSTSSPILWWSPDPRCVIFPEAFHVPRRLNRVLRSGRFRLSIDEAFSQVIRRCASIPRFDKDNENTGTWIVPEMIAAYEELHRLGVAHSVEAWDEQGLAGGLYGVQLGKIFWGESMFHERPDASKAALVELVQRLRVTGGTMLDCQMMTSHLQRFGAVELSRHEFLQRLKKALDRG